jgi:hypothetical protein
MLDAMEDAPEDLVAIVAREALEDPEERLDGAREVLVAGEHFAEEVVKRQPRTVGAGDEASDVGENIGERPGHEERAYLLDASVAQRARDITTADVRSRIALMLVPPRAPARRRHLQVVPEPHGLLGRLLPPLDAHEVEVAAERVRQYGQREPIEMLDGEIVAGWQEYRACIEVGVVPSYTEITEPQDLVEYIVRRNVPRYLSTLDRACIAVLAQVEFRKLSLDRKREGGRIGGMLRGLKDRATVARSFEGERWTHTAARVVGTTEGAVRHLASLHRNAPDVFAAVRARRIRALREARELAREIKDPADRMGVLARYEGEGRSTPLLELAYDRRRELLAARTEPGAPVGARYHLYTGDMVVEAKRIPTGSIDVVHADVVYGDLKMIAAVARISARTLKPGCFLALLAGHEDPRGVINTVCQERLDLVAIGAWLMPHGSDRGLRAGAIKTIDSLPVYLFANGKLARPVDHVTFTTGPLEKALHGWQKPLDATTDLISALLDPAGTTVLDPCMGSGTTLEAALRLGCARAIGIDLDPAAVKVAAARLSKVERELASAERAR